METPLSLPLEDLIPWPGMNSRHFFEPVAMGELSASLREVGMAQPIGVTLQPKKPHWIYAGERRWKAAKGIMKEVPVHIRALTEAQAIKLNLTENIQRKDLTPMEEAHGLQRYMEKAGLVQTAVAKEMGKTQGWVSNRIRLLRLPMPLQELFDEGAFTQSQARDLILPFASLPDDQWNAFSKALTKPLVRKFKKGKRGLTEEEIREPASKVAMAMSGWLDHHQWQQDKSTMFDARTHIPKKRWKDAPSGTVITYLYGEYPHNRSTRAFDLDWWEGEMHLALAEDAEAAERRKREIEEGDGELGEGGQDLDWTPSLGPMPIEMYVPHYQRHVVYVPVDPDPREQDYSARDTLSGSDAGVRRTGNLNADPTIIPKDNLIIKLGRGGDQCTQSQVLCTDYAVYEAAVESLLQKRDALAKRRIGRQAQTDVLASKSIALAQAIPSLLAVGMTLQGGNFIDEVAEDLEISPTWKKHKEKVEDVGDFDVYAWAVELQNYLAGLKKTQLDAIAKLLVYRLTRSPSGKEMDMRAHVRQSVAFEMRVKLLKDLGETLDLPKWQKGTKDAEKECF